MNRNQFAFLDPVTGLDPPAFNLDFTVFDKFGCRNPRQPFRLLTYVLSSLFRGLLPQLPGSFFPQASFLLRAQNTAYVINRTRLQ